MKYKFLEHTADAKFLAYGKNLEEAFSNAAIAMFSVMTDVNKIKPLVEKKIEVKANDNEGLLYGFLEQLLILLDTEGFLLNKVKEIKIKDNKLNAIVVGDKFKETYELHGDVKAVTYHEMEIKKEKNKIVIQVVVDT